MYGKRNGLKNPIGAGIIKIIWGNEEKEYFKSPNNCTHNMIV